MKAIRMVFFSFFALTALISINMMFNLFRHGGFGYGDYMAAAGFFILVQINGLIFVIMNNNRVIMGIFSIATGLAAMLSGFLAFGALGAPASQILTAISVISRFVAPALFIGYLILGVLFFSTKPVEVEAEANGSMKFPRIVFFSIFGLSALISVYMMYHLLSHSTVSGGHVAAGCVLIAAQAAGLILVILKRSRVLMGIFTVATGIATLFSGLMAIGMLGAPAHQFGSMIPQIIEQVFPFLFVGYIALGVLFIAAKPAKAGQAELAEQIEA